MAERRDRAGERLVRAHAGSRDDDVVLDVFRRASAELDRVEVGAGAAVEPPEQERQRLAQMSEAELGARKPVEDPAEDDAERMRAGLERPFPGRAAQSLVTIEHRRRYHRI